MIFAVLLRRLLTGFSPANQRAIVLTDPTPKWIERGSCAWPMPPFILMLLGKDLPFSGEIVMLLPIPWLLVSSIAHLTSEFLV